jgi:UDPglucose 6-dehydrogenase
MVTRSSDKSGARAAASSIGPNEADDRDGHERTDGVDANVDSRGMTPDHAGLMELVGHRVDNGQGERPRERPAPVRRHREGTPEQQRENAEHRHVAELPYDEVHSLVRQESQVRLGGEHEDQRGPGDDRHPGNGRATQATNGSKESPFHSPTIRVIGERPRTAVIGAGYVGVATAVGLAERGHDVVLVERDHDRRAALVRGRIPFHEPGLPEAFAAQHAAGRILPVAEIPDSELDLVVICVGTPIDDTGYGDVSHVAHALEQAMPSMTAGAVSVIRSTLPVGSASRLAFRAGVESSRLFVAPEFLRQGNALHDIREPTRVVIGTFSEDPDPIALALVTGALARPGTPLLVMRAEEASLVKNASNVFLALRLTFANEVAGLAEDLGVDVGPVLDGIGHDPRIGHAYMSPSFGFGGSCLPKEVRTLSTSGLDRGLPMHLAAAISEANADHQRRFARRIAQAIGGLAGKRIALLGLAFKANTDDVRSSPALRLAARLLDDGADLRAHDPVAGDNARRALPELIVVDTAEEALRDADAAVIATEWAEYRDLDWGGLRPSMRRPLIVDGRRLLPEAKLRALGYDVTRLGDGLEESASRPEPDRVTAR